MYKRQFEDSTIVGSISLFKGSFEHIAPNVDDTPLPPKSFVDGLRINVARESRNYSLLLWMLNSKEMSLNHGSAHQRFPFLVFKKDQPKAYQNYLDIKKIPIGDLSMDLTLAEREDGPTDSYLCSIFPSFLQRTYYDHFQMDLLAQDYKTQFAKIMRRYKGQFSKAPKFASVYLNQNLTLLTRAYIRDLFYDITFKYASWKQLSGSEKMSLLKALQNHHKTHTFVLSTNSSPLSDFIEQLDHTTCMNCSSDMDMTSKLTYGIWSDSEKGTILLCNGIVMSWDMAQVPTYGYQINDDENTFLTKYMFFINMSVLETCMWCF